MKTLNKIILSLILLSLFLFACLLISATSFVGIWLRTYQVFTDKTLVAEVSISELRQDENGEFAIVKYKPIKNQSALARIFFKDETRVEEASEQEFKVYGDSIHIGGPIIKFKDNLILLDFKTIYKVAKIFGRYNIDNEKEINKNEIQMQFSNYDLNGGIDATWKDLSENLSKDSFKSKIYNFFIDTTQLSVPGQFVLNTPQTYNLYITNTGFLWDQKN
ncbi:MAG: hypothetical protein KatS3mg085_475 [Candidatus Dojkabacteria bacterium]|nr:MAG: hypothetical protein KatS3mg085_475 [Candidatus Dojkabacteria bacterium]